MANAMLTLLMKTLLLAIFATWGNMLSAQITDVNDRPDKQVNQVLSLPTVFPDKMYQTTTWQSFVTSNMANTPIDTKHIDYGLLNAAVFYYTNKYRAEQHLPELKFSAELRNAALFQSLEMVNRNFFDHTNPRNHKMRTPENRMKYFGFDILQASGENIATEFLLDASSNKEFYSSQTNTGVVYYYGDNENDHIAPVTYAGFAEKIVQDWIDSPPHRANLRQRHYKYLGCGVVPNYRSGTINQLPEAYGTQDFGG